MLQGTKEQRRLALGVALALTAGGSVLLAGAPSAEAASKTITEDRPGRVDGSQELDGSMSGNELIIGPPHGGQTPVIGGEDGAAGAFNPNGSVSSNKVIVHSVLTGMAAHPTWIVGGISANGNAVGNGVAFNGGKVIGAVSGGNADSGTGDAERNEVIMSGGEVTTDLYGGASYDVGSAVGNKVTITGGTVGEAADDKVAGGLVDGTGNAVNNEVRISGGHIKGLYGGWAKTGAVIGNTITISGGTVDDVVKGGHADGAGNAERNEVTVTDGTMQSDVKGGFSTDGSAVNNTLTVAGGDITNAAHTASVHGGLANSMTADSLAQNNTLNLAGGTIDHAYGASVRTAAGRAVGNRVFLSFGAAADTVRSITGGYAATATDNTVEIKAGKITGTALADQTFAVVGGHAETAGGTASRNRVAVLGGDITGGVFGGAAMNGNADGNTVTVADNATVTGAIGGGGSYSISGGHMDAGTGSGSHNIVSIGRSAIAGDVGGGYGTTTNDNVVSLAGTRVAGDVTGGSAADGTGNTLAIRDFGTEIKDFGGVQNLHFYIPAGTTARPDLGTMLTLKDVTGAAKDLGNITVGVALAGNRPTLSVGDTVSLMKAYRNNSTLDADAVPLTAPDTIVNHTTGMQGVSLRYGFDIRRGADNELAATVTSAAVSEQTKSLVETKAASAALINSGADLLTDTGMNAAAEAASGTGGGARPAAPGGGADFNMWAAQGGSALRLNSGSHVDARGWNLNLGFAKKAAAGRNVITYGPFIEYGRSTYDSYLDDGTHGDGKTSYFGAGVMAKAQGPRGAYVEGSLRVGRVKSDYSGNISGMDTGYDMSSTYYAAHIGFGLEKTLKGGNVLEGYAKYFYAHQGGASAALRSGETYDFDSVDSHRIRIGARYTHKIDARSAFYTGLAYEYEFAGEARASYQGTARRARA